jgi:hypothetical protein
MTVKAREEHADRDEASPRGAALFSRRRLAQQQTAFEQFVAWLLLIISFVGSVLLGGGGVEAWVRWQPNLWLAGAALAFQGVLTYVPWIYAERGWQAWPYVATVLVSSALTAGGYWQLVHPWGVRLLAGWQVLAANAPYFAGGLIIVAALLIDIFPEQTLTA